MESEKDIVKAIIEALNFCNESFIKEAVEQFKADPNNEFKEGIILGMGNVIGALRNGVFGYFGSDEVNKMLGLDRLDDLLDSI